VKAHLARAVAAALGVALVAACGPGAPAVPAREVVCFTSHDRMHSEPILALFEQRTGIVVKAVYDTEATKTTQLASRLLARKDAPEADVLWNNEVAQAELLARAGVLEPYFPPSAAEIPARFKDPAGHWTGFAARARVILVNTTLCSLAEAPRTLADLATPAWRGRFAIARPLFGTTRTHMAALRAHLGGAAFEAFAEGLFANDPVVVEGNAVARNMVAEGKIPACLTDTDDAHGAIADGRPVAMIYPDQAGMGTLVIPNTASLIKGARHGEAARALIDFLTSAEVEGLLAQSAAAQLPVRASVAPKSAQFRVEGLVVLDVAPARMADELEATSRFFEARLGKR